MPGQFSGLPCKLCREPDIVCVEECYILSPGSLKPEIPRCTLPPIHVATMLKIDNALALQFGIPSSYRCASIGRAVVHKQQLPVIPCLCHNALNCLFEERFSVEEN